ncbi:hypothetical protein [Nitrospirillum sp. BR 11163]|uniref:hypothetical protein n=1 Tax=Nitrospirillum sp. BR 11163 TaxID=3104323 RepID=UPI002AFFE227|nr:hypothetical protein [Nitrospirillum sp. BR 11163]MEA1676045.1 hypothetical protein [Nitrospirillum sp. BR 11163]
MSARQGGNRQKGDRRSPRPTRKGTPVASPPMSVRITSRARWHMAAAAQVIAGAALILASSALWAAIIALLLFATAAGTLVWARWQA